MFIFRIKFIGGEANKIIGDEFALIMQPAPKFYRMIAYFTKSKSGSFMAGVYIEITTAGSLPVLIV